jgi:hypothetical protein
MKHSELLAGFATEQKSENITTQNLLNFEQMTLNIKVAEQRIKEQLLAEKSKQKLDLIKLLELSKQLQIVRCEKRIVTALKKELF